MEEFWNEEQILRNVPEKFRFLYHKVKDEYLLENERILLGAYCSRSLWSEFGSELHLGNIPSVIFISSRRYFRTGIVRKDGSVISNKSFVYRQQGKKRRWLNFDADERPFAEWQWILPPTEIPKKSEGFVIETPLSSLAEIRGQQPYTIDIQQKPINLLEIDFGNSWLTFLKPDGDYFYRLLQTARVNNGEIHDYSVHQTKNIPQDIGIADELSKLATLYERNLITKEEFETAKRKILF